MSCIVGLMHRDFVYMGADSCVSEPDCEYHYSLGQEKIIRKGELLFGIAGTTRLMSIIEHMDIPPLPSGETCLLRSLDVSFIPALRKELREAGYLEVKDGKELFCGAILIAGRGQLVELTGGFGMALPRSSFHAVGSGTFFALGAMSALEAIEHIVPEEKIRLALTAAARYSAYVKGPFNITQARNWEEDGRQNAD